MAGNLASNCASVVVDMIVRFGNATSQWSPAAEMLIMSSARMASVPSGVFSSMELVVRI